jgi:hypothetical protein
MYKTDIHPDPGYFMRYIDLVENMPLKEALNRSLADLDAIDEVSWSAVADLRYAPGKWTVKEVLQHIIDGERVMAYRTLLYARQIQRSPTSIDFEWLNEQSRASERSLGSLLRELRAVRLSSIEMFSSFDNPTLLLTGINWKYEMSVLAMGFFLVGHQLHHFRIIDEKYLPEIGKTQC